MTAIDPIRSATMRAVKSKNTQTELKVRSLVHRLGFRFRLHRKELPGTPDLVFPARRKAIFVHGCFWHGHDCARGCRMPKTNCEYWKSKIDRNRQRDAANLGELRADGWQVLTIWECKISDSLVLAEGLRRFLE
jgi:DNA mismatch endonuclease (patch repair protein)